jgi:hypothetical protein
MVVYSSTEVLKVATSPTSIASMLLVGSTRLTIDFGKTLVSPPIVEASHPLIETLLVPLMLALVVNEDRQYIRNRDGLNILLLPLWRIFLGQILI